MQFPQKLSVSRAAVGGDYSAHRLLNDPFNNLSRPICVRNGQKWRFSSARSGSYGSRSKAITIQI